MKRQRLFTGGPADRHLPAVLAGALGAGCCLLLPGVAIAGEIRAAGGPLSLGTRINGADSCSAGACTVTGGTAAGRNLFHRFSLFDTRGAINSVNIQNKGYRSVMVGVTDPLGSFIDKPVSLSRPGQLYWLSPGGIQLSGAGTFLNVQQLTLSTATGLRVGDGLFNAVTTPADQVAALAGLPGLVSTEADTLGGLGLLTNGDLSIDGGLLTVDQGLLVDAQGGHLLLNGARLAAPGGEAVLTAANTELRGAVVDVSAPGEAAGRVLVQSADNTLVAGASVLRAEGAQGGSVDVLGRTVTLADQAAVLASGSRGGGQVRIGGDYLGGNPAVRNAWQTVVGPEVQVQANATRNGDGGRVIVWADDATVMQGRLEARGGLEGGDGGFIETSGKRLLSVGAIAPDASAPEGNPGTWLLDPLTINVGSDSVGVAITSGDPTIVLQEGGVGPSVVATVGSDLIEAALGNGSVQIVSPDGITISDSIAPQSVADGATLTLDSSGGITQEASGFIRAQNTLSLNVRLRAGGGGVVLGSFIDAGTGDISISAGGPILLAGSTAPVLKTSGGTITLVANGANGAIASANPVVSAPLIDSGAGRIALRSSGSVGVGDGVNTFGLSLIAAKIAVEADSGLSLPLGGDVIELQIDAPEGEVAIGRIPISDPQFFGINPGDLSASSIAGVNARNGAFDVRSDLSNILLSDDIPIAGAGTSSLSARDAVGRIRVEPGALVRIIDTPSDAPPVVGVGGGGDGIGAGVRPQTIHFDGDLDVGRSSVSPGVISVQQGTLRLNGFAVNRGIIHVASGAALALRPEAPGSANPSLTLENGSILSGGAIPFSASPGFSQSAVIGDPVEASVILQNSGAEISPGDGIGLSGKGSVGELLFSNVQWQIRPGARLAVDLRAVSAPGALASDRISSFLTDRFPDVPAVVFGGAPIVAVALENPSVIPTPNPSLGVIADPVRFQSNSSTQQVEPLNILPSVIDGINQSRLLSDGIQGVFRSGSLAFDYQGVSLPPGPSPSPGPSPGPAPAPQPNPSPTPNPSPNPSPPPPPNPSPTPQPTPPVNPELSLQVISQLEQPIIPPFDIKPSLLVNQTELDPLGNSLLSVNIGESDLGLLVPDADEDEPRLTVEQQLREPTATGRATSELTSSLDRSISVPASPPGTLGTIPTASAEGSAEASLVISIDDPSISQTMQALQAAEVRRSQDINTNLSGVEPPAGAPTELTSPALQEQLEAAVQAIRSGLGGQTR